MHIGVTLLSLLLSHLLTLVHYCQTILQQAIKETGATQIVDLCSGGGGPHAQLLPAVAKELGHPIKMTLTDLFPHVEGWKKVRREGWDGMEGWRYTRKILFVGWLE